ncbi:hypothetical protein Dimus_018309 [Dionaea muscipula]
MVGHRGYSQRRVREVGCDSRSPDTFPMLVRGSPSPAVPHFRREPPSHGRRIRHQRNPSPMLSSSPDLDDFRSTEESEATAAAESSSADKDHSDSAGGTMDPAQFLYPCPVPEKDVLHEVSSSTASSGSSIPSSTTAVLRCQEAIISGGCVGGWLKVARSESVCSFSSPVAGGCSLASTGVRQEVGEADGTQGGVEQPCSVVSLLGSFLPDSFEVPVCEQLSLAAMNGVEVDLGVASGGSVAADGDARCPALATVAALYNNSESLTISHLPLSYVADAVVGLGTVNGDVQTLEFAKSGADSLLPWLSDVVGSCGGGTVSKEGRVLQVTRGALRPQPADGLREPLSPPVEPVSVVKGGVGQDGRSGGRSYAHVVQRRVREVSCDSRSPDTFPMLVRGSPSPAAPHFWPGPPSLGRRIHHQRSPSPMLSSSPDLDDFSSTEEGEAIAAAESSSAGEDRSDSTGCTMDAAQFLHPCPVPEKDGMHEGSISTASSGSSIPSPTTALLKCQEAIFSGGCVGGWSKLLRVDVLWPLLASGRSFEAPVCEQLSLAAMDGVEEDLGVASGGSVAADGDARCPAVATVAALYNNMNGDVQTLEFAKSGADSLFPRLSDVGDSCGGGTVSEEGRVLPVTRGALRPQPADGLRQPLSSPVEPVSVVEGGVGQDGHSGGRSYAHVVQVDRRADVELSYLPPVGGGNTITMEESDGDKLQ